MILQFAVSLAVLAAIFWGVADFVGAYAAREIDGQLVAACTSLAALILAAIASFSAAEREVIGFTPAAFCFAAGVLAVFGLGLFFSLLGRASASRVAPSAGVASTATPVTFGIILGDALNHWRLAGFVLAFGAIAIGASESSARRASRSGVSVTALAAGSGGLMGLYLVATGYFAEYGFQAVACAHLGAVVCQAARGKFSTLRSSPVRAVGLCGVSGCLYHLAALCYRDAATSDSISIIGAIASMYPVVTVFCAVLWLRQRPTLFELSSLVLCLIALMCFAAG
jgi:uncharacterized membrane protein